MKTRTTNTATTKVSPKDKLLGAILKGIEDNNLLPWDNGRLNANRTAVNRATGKKYKGINRLALNNASDVLANPTQEWVTFKQAQSLKGSVRKGEHGFPIVFFSLWDKERKCFADDESKDKDVIPLLKSSVVFDLCQCEGIEVSREYKTIEHKPLDEVDALVEKFAEATNLRLELDKQADNGFYSPTHHKVSVAGLRYYKTPDEYYSTLFHELVHSTMKAMGRDKSGFFGDEKYSEEEVVAECGAMLLCMEFGIEKKARDNSLSYVKHWGGKIAENKDWLFRGMSQAEKAVEFILEKADYKPVII